MKKIKEFFDKLLYESADDDEDEKVVEVRPEPAVRKVQPQVKKEEVKPEPVKKEPEVVEVIREERKTPSFITLPKTEEPVEETVEEVIEEVKPEPVQEPVKEEPVKEPVKEMTEEERRRELDYRTSTVISPMFGVQEKKEEKGARRHAKKAPEPEKIPDLADIQSNNKSVLGTVFSPLYGDKDASDSIPHDDIAEEVASLTVDDFIDGKKAEAVRETVTEAVEEPVRETLANRPDLIVSPFGVKENPAKEKLNDDQYYENISLFDLEDK